MILRKIFKKNELETFDEIVSDKAFHYDNLIKLQKIMNELLDQRNLGLEKTTQ